MAVPPAVPPLPLEAAPSLNLVHSPVSTTSGSFPSTPSGLSSVLNSPEGIDCYGNERQALTDQAKYFNNATLSDIVLIVGGEKYFAHKLILVRSSDVFERMLSSEWSDPSKKEIELIEDSMCISVFPRFLKFLYGCHIKLNMETTLQVLILADKYNVEDLRNVCINFACSYIIPKLQLKDVFHVWFQYSTKCYHQRLVGSCVQALAEKMDDIMVAIDWEREWINLDKEQLIEFLKSSDLTIKDEYELWLAVVKWMKAPSYPERASNMEINMKELLEYIRFPLMSPEQLHKLEMSSVVQQYHELFRNYFMLAYKYHALPLTVRATIKEFTTSSFLLRNYTDLRWDKRFVINHYSACLKCAEVPFRFSTRSSTYPPQTWEWELKIHPKGFSSTSEDFRVVLYSNLILDQPRPVEYLLSIVDRNGIIHTVAGKKNFSKTRYTIDTEMDKKVSVTDLCQINSPLLVDDSLILQILLKPVD